MSFFTHLKHFSRSLFNLVINFKKLTTLLETNMKTTLVLLSLVFSTAIFAKEGDFCNPGKKALEKAAYTLAKINNPEGEITVQLAPTSADVKAFVVIVDDNYGISLTDITTAESQNGFCRIKSVTEQ